MLVVREYPKNYPFVFLHTFYPNFSIFLHRYICHICDILQLCHIVMSVLHSCDVCILTHFLPQVFNIFTQIYLPYLWHFATLVWINHQFSGVGGFTGCMKYPTRFVYFLDFFRFFYICICHCICIWVVWNFEQKIVSKTDIVMTHSEYRDTLRGAKNMEN